MDYSEIEALTDANAHLEAKLEMAKMFQHERAAKVFTALIMLRDAESCTTQPAQEIARGWRNLLIISIANTHGVEESKLASQKI